MSDRGRRFRPVWCAVFLAASFFPLRSSAARSSVPTAASGPQQQARAAEAAHVDRAPELDGSPDDPLWQAANPIDEFRQREPREGQSASERTEVRVLYTRRAVYFGIHCYDSDPAGIVARELRRDVAQELDDHFELSVPARRRDSAADEGQTAQRQAQQAEPRRLRYGRHGRARHFERRRGEGIEWCGDYPARPCVPGKGAKVAGVVEVPSVRRVRGERSSHDPVLGSGGEEHARRRV